MIGDLCITVCKCFLSLCKSKYLRTNMLICSILILTAHFFGAVQTKCDDTTCSGNGVCKNEECICDDGWLGPQCQFCGGKVSKEGAPSGVIHDGVGNYSTSAKCTWLVNAPNSSITFHLEEFVTECGWDNLYIYDGDSVNAPVLAVFSGLMYKSGYGIRRIPEVVAKSGSALLHFASDGWGTMSGFNLTYRLNACPSQISGVDCSGRGVCIDGVCTCEAQWFGTACHLPKCPGDCGKDQNRGRCEPEKHGCVCEPGFQGDDCGQITSLGYWETVSPLGYYPPGSASHGAAVWRDSLYIVAGDSYTRGQMMYIYDFNGNVWETPYMVGSLAPSPRYAHSTVLYGDKLFVYGGVLGNRGPTSELWAFDISSNIWENVTAKPSSKNILRGPLKSAGHTATIVTNKNNKKADKMVVIFGHSPNLGYLNIVQEYYFATREWHIVKTRGFPVKGSYGHSASWDPLTRKIYVYGGIVSEDESLQALSTRLYVYEPDTQIWTLLTDAPSARFLHTATFVSPGLMLVFGGNTQIYMLSNSSDKCYSSDLLAYDVTCDSWHHLSVPVGLQSDLARFGHSAVMFADSLYIYGGFNGQMLSDMLKYTPGNCKHLTTITSCLNTLPGVKCVWHHKNSKCITVMELSKSQYWASADELEGVISKCSKGTARKMHVVHLNSIESQEPVTWSRVCSEFTSCLNCMQEECIWCQNESRCVDKNAYTASFPYGQCREWTTVSSECRSRGAQASSQCSFYVTCAQCRNDPACGWCDDGSRTGLGQCLPGGYTGPNLHEYSLPSSTCPPERWHFTTCPACQCNGHASCHANSSQCQPCGDLTTGHHCETCIPGYWGNPVNGGRCELCDCNGQATQCNAETGKCYCTTKGLTGDHCEKCDATNHYYGDPSNKGSCYYDLTIDYQFTFNLSKKEDRHVTQQNFRISPIKPDMDTRFTITCSMPAKFNVTVKKATGSEQPILTNQNCSDNFTYEFKKTDYSFGVVDDVPLTTFSVYVYELKTPLWLQVSFAQPPKLNVNKLLISLSTLGLLVP